MNQWSIYKVGNTIVVPHELLFDGGPLLEVAPFRTLDASAQNIHEQLVQLFREPNLTVLPRKYSKAETAVLKRNLFLKLLGVRSETELAKKARLWTIEEKDGAFNVALWVASKTGGLEIDQSKSDAFEKNMTLDRVIPFLIDAFNS